MLVRDPDFIPEPCALLRNSRNSSEANLENRPHDIQAPPQQHRRSLPSRFRGGTALV